MKKTKIICTLGPNADDEAVMRQLVVNGMDVARFNFSHGDHGEHKKRFRLLREVAEEEGIPVAALLDTKGPEIRTGTLKDGKKITLTAGNEIILTTEEIAGDERMIHINYSGLHEDVAEGNVILIDDGLIELSVERVEKERIYCRIINGGELGERKGVNVPNVKIKLPALTDKDKEDIRFGIELGFDYIAASFVRSADAIREIREILNSSGSSMGIIAKIENAEGLENLDEIIEASDGIMVARGDLGVEIPAEDVPVVQRELIEKCRIAGKPVITATQMLDSMKTNPNPTRAEVSDVANAVLESSDCVMLSAESANGEYPVLAAAMQAKISSRMEKYLNYYTLASEEFNITAHQNEKVKDINAAMANTICQTAVLTDTELIICFSSSPLPAKLISKSRPRCPILFVTDNRTAAFTSCLCWGIYPVLIPHVPQFIEEMEVIALLQARKLKLVPGTRLIITGSNPSGSKSTNFMKVISVNEPRNLDI